MNERIRLATAEDAKSILQIYAPYVAETSVSFETQIPSLREFTARVVAICAQFPYLVYEADGNIVAYAYASKHRERAAYRFDVDLSVYIAQEYHGKGIAKRLYHCLFALLEKQGYYNAYAGYTVPNQKSERFHRKFGFEPIGTHHKTGYKFGKWRDTVWMEKAIAAHPEAPAEPRPITALPGELVQTLCNQSLKDA